GVVVYWNDGGAFNATSVTGVPPPEGVKTIYAVTTIQADADPEPELALVTDRGIWIADIQSGRRIVVRDTPAFIGKGSEVGEFGRMFAADVDSDGLEDLVLGLPSQILFFTARQGTPLGTTE